MSFDHLQISTMDNLIPFLNDWQVGAKQWTAVEHFRPCEGLGNSHDNMLYTYLGKHMKPAVIFMLFVLVVQMHSNIMYCLLHRLL